MKKNGKKIVKKFFIIIMMMIISVPPQVMAEENKSVDTSISGNIDVTLNIDGQDFRQYLDAFHLRYPNIKVNYKYLANYEEDIRTLMDQNSPGDVYFVPGFLNSSEYAKYFESLGRSEDLSNKYSFLAQSKVVNGTVYGLASDAYLSGFVYNTRVFYNAGITSLPTTIDEFLEDLHLIKERTDAIPFYTNYEAAWTQQYWEDFPFIEMTGSSDYKAIQFLDEKNPYLEGTNHYKVYKLLYDIVAQGLCEEDPQKSDWAESKKMMNRGEIGCMCIGSWALGQIKAAGTHGKDISFMPFPNNIDGKQYATIATDYCYAVNKNSQNKEAAKAFVNFMIDESGYAMDHDTLSIVKSDPYPEVYRIDNLVILYNRASSPEYQKKSDKLYSKLDLRNSDEIGRVIAAGAGFSDESFEDIVKDWNTRWESSRTSDMVEGEASYDTKKDNKEVVLDYEVKFSDSEQQYLKRTKSLKVGYLREMQPLQKIEKDQNKNNIIGGVAKEVCDVITKNTNIKFQMLPYDNTEAMVKAIKKGEIDLIACMDNQYDSAKNIKYSKAYVTAMKAIVTKKAKISDKKKLGTASVVEGEKTYFYNDEKQKQSYKTIEDSVKAVEDNEVDYSIQNYYSANYYMQKLKLESIKLIPMSTSINYSMAFDSSIDSRLISICNKCIYSIQDARMQMLLLNNMEVDEKVTLRQFIEENSIEVLLIALSVSVIIIFTIVTFYREKTRHLAQQEVAAKRYQALYEMSDEYWFEYNVRTDRMTFEKKLENDFGFLNSIRLKEYNGKSESMNNFVTYFKQSRNREETQTFQMTTVNGKKRWYRLVSSVITDNRKNPVRVIGKLVSAQEEMKKVEQLQEIVGRDKLTGLLNREGFFKTFEAMEKKMKGKPMSIAILDVDNFKSVNDSIGHSGGDAALMKVAEVLRHTVGEKGVAARYGGDEFIIVIPGADIEIAERIYRRIVRRMRTVISYEGHQHALSVSVGAVWTDVEMNFEKMFDIADKELYRVKECGRDNWHLRQVV